MKVPKAHRLESGTWYIQMRLGGGSQYVTGATEKEAIRKAELIKAQHRNELRDASLASAGTLDAALSDYISSRKNVLSPSTVAGYNTIKRTRFLAYSKQKIDRINYQKMVNEEARLCGAKTLYNAFALVASAVEFSGLPRPKVTLPQVVKTEHPFLTAEQIPLFLEAVKDQPVEMAALLGLHGMRRSEIIGMSWENVDLKKKLLHIRGSVVRNSENEFIRKDTNKNRSSRRTVPIIIPRLTELLEQTPAAERTGPLVHGYPNKIWSNVNKACRAAKLPEVGAHGLRHSFVSLAYHCGIPPLETMRLGGYSDPTTMTRIYTHLAQSDITAAADKLKAFYTSTP